MPVGRVSPPTGTVPTVRRRLPIGAEPRGEAGTHFRVWAPEARAVAVALVGTAETSRLSARVLGSPVALEDRDAAGYFSGLVPQARAGSRYLFELDHGPRLPDPASRFQPAGPHGPSEVIDPTFDWTDSRWPGPTAPGAVVYELHVGTFTPRGTLASAARDLPALVELGISVVELMPVAEFPGRFGWGYDGVLPFAPSRLYGQARTICARLSTTHTGWASRSFWMSSTTTWVRTATTSARSRTPISREPQRSGGAGFNCDGPESGPVQGVHSSQRPLLDQRIPSGWPAP